MKCKKGYHKHKNKCVKNKHEWLPQVFNSKKGNRINFIFFVLIAPFLVKGIEWLGMMALGNHSHDFTLPIFLWQVGFFGIVSAILFFTFKTVGKEKLYPIIPGLAYSLKEIYNQFIRNIFAGGISFNLFNFSFGVIIEPVVMYFIVSVLVWKFGLRKLYKV